MAVCHTENQKPTHTNSWSKLVALNWGSLDGPATGLRVERTANTSGVACSVEAKAWQPTLQRMCTASGNTM